MKPIPPPQPAHERTAAADTPTTGHVAFTLDGRPATAEPGATAVVPATYPPLEAAPR